jgi:CubicO group peptidase (beta-lactamase class C family)
MLSKIKIEKEILKQKLTDQGRLRILDGWFPGCVIGVVWNNGERLIVPVGHFTDKPGAPSVAEDSIYDVASITKAIPTACLLLKLIDGGAVKMEESIVKWIPELKIRERNNILIRHLLEFTLNYDNPEYSLRGMKYKSADEMSKFLFASELKTPPGTAYFYNNATAILTGLVIERVAGKPLNVLANEIFFSPLGMTSTNFRPEKLDNEKIVPTEIDPWRRGEVRAEVHDESAWTMRKEKNQCVGSAGLFSSAPDLLTFLEMLLHGGTLNGRRYFSEKMVAQMHTNQLAAVGEYQGLGWKMERPWMGARHSPNAFGMSGFTGTSVLVDPDRGAGVVILSNGIYPMRDRAQKEGLRDKFRAEILDMVFETKNLAS